MPLYFLFAIALLIVIGVWVFSRFYHKHMLGAHAPEQSARVVVIDKQSIDIEDAAAGEEDKEYWIYVQKGRFGPKREFQVGVHYFQALSPGDKGDLTYKGGKFIHFARLRESS